MCGIAGVRRFGEEPITGEELVLLLCSLEHRGVHATGVALDNPEGIRVYKAAEPAWQFTKRPEFSAFLEANLTEETKTALLHTRMATIGNPKNNDNNHPIYDGETAIVHNGGINNHELLFHQGRYTKSCETDSDIVRAIVSAHGFEEKGMRELCKMSGSAAIACVSVKYPDKLLLARSGSPLVYGFDEGGAKMYWASEAEALLQATRPWKQVRGAWVQSTKSPLDIGSMPDNTAWLVGPEGVELHHVFNTCQFYRAPDYSRGRENYHSKMSAWKRDNKHQTAGTYSPAHILPPVASAATIDVKLLNAVIKCPGCGIPVRNVHGRSWAVLSCPKCNSGLAA